jgi:formylglycine-generating enzyme required for sulfatase activity
MNRVFRDQIISSDGTLVDEGPEMVEIPAGRYLRGSPASEADRRDTEGPQLKVTIARPFALSATQVTVGQYKLYLAHRQCFPNRQWDEHDWQIKVPMVIGGNVEWFTRLEQHTILEKKGLLSPTNPEIRLLAARRFQQADHFPAHYINWYDGRGYAEWLSERTGHNYRLPSEAEWEYAVRAGMTTPYASGETMSEELDKLISACGKATYPGGMTGRKRRGFPPAKFFAPNEWGIYPNYCVDEWCEDAWQENYHDAPTDGSARPPFYCDFTGSDYILRVVRGGTRFASRRGDGGGFRNRYRGFRIALDM